ncbi:MAG: hypothetical protein K0R00_66 [Herbinix sp.]|jgi:hypothetical protein|nr:hypothetical protein [Herbinix sp.]
MKAWKHFKLISLHKWYVFKNCCRAGIYLQGITHDVSKYSPTEYFESIKYYTGTRSPIEACKELNGYSMAWFHHRGRNKHHWEYWVDNFEQGMTYTLIPYKYAVELLCDWIGAGQAYEKENWSFQSQYRWWKKKVKTAKLHPVIAHFIDTILALMSINNTYLYLNKEHTRDIYDTMVTLYGQGILEEACPYYPE